MERDVLTRADEIITITPFYVKQFEHLARRQVRLLTNGFDEDDFSEIVYEKTDRFIIRHVGVVNEKCDPRPFMQALKKEMEANPFLARDLRLEFIGEVHPDFRRYIGETADVHKVTVFTGNIPHGELLRLYGSSSLLLLILTGYKDAEGFLPGKLFEYFATGLPVLGVGPAAGDAGALMKETGGGVMIDTEDQEGMRKVLRKVYENWRTDPKPGTNSGQVRRFSRKQITGQLVDILQYQQHKTAQDPKV